VVITVAFRLATFIDSDRESNPTLTETLFIVWTQAESCYSLMSATVPCLRPFVINLNTHFGGLGAGESQYGYSSGERSDNNTYELLKMKSAGKSGTTSTTGNEPHTDFATRQAPAARLDGTSDLYSYGVWAAPSLSSRAGRRISGMLNDNAKADATSVESNDSEKMIIRKDVTYSVHRD
jgi:hypothetical protein